MVNPCLLLADEIANLALSSLRSNPGYLTMGFHEANPRQTCNRFTQEAQPDEDYKSTEYRLRLLIHALNRIKEVVGDLQELVDVVIRYAESGEAKYGGIQDQNWTNNG